MQLVGSSDQMDPMKLGRNKKIPPLVVLNQTDGWIEVAEERSKNLTFP